MFTILFTIIFFLHTGLTSTPTTPIEPKNILECTAKGGECDETKGTAVCGTDNKTYPTRCHLIRAQCSGHDVSLKFRGECNKGCIVAKTYAIAHITKSNNFIPRCRLDGSYAPMQCNMDGHGCWCSDSYGNRIPNKFGTNGKLVCAKDKKKKSNMRRSPSRNQNNNRNKRGCTSHEQKQLNTNLIKAFQTEFLRYQTQNTYSTGTSITDTMILDWKFGSLDINENNELDKNEYRELKKIIRKVVKPKRCARHFGKFCDINLDEKLSRSEWTNCITKDNLNHETHQATGDINDDNTNPDVYDDIDNDEGITDTDEHINDRNIHNNKNNNTHRPRPYNQTSYPPVYLLRPKTFVEADPVVRDGDIDQGCEVDRANALENQLNGSGPYYVPQCTADGRYQRLQCYLPSGFCWCVHEDLGTNIVGTSTKHGLPDCANNVVRPMKGCPEPKKKDFLRDLKEFLKRKMPATTNSGVNSTKFASEDEKIATLSFVLLDKNKNKLWERREWKIFRDLVTGTRGLRKCGKKMPRYCDVNNDKKITLSEWLNCLQANRYQVPEAITRNTNETLGSKGQNPLDTYLKSD